MFEKIQRLIKTIFKQEFAKASTYYIIANIIGQGIVLVSSAIFTRIMSKSDYGLVSTYSTWVLVINTFICLNLFITVRNAYIDFKDDYDNFNSSVLTLNILFGTILTLVIIGGSVILGFESNVEEIMLACIQSVALNIVNYKLAIQAMKNEYKQRAFLMIVPNWTHILLSIVLMLIFTKNMYMAKIAGNAFGLLFFAIVCIIELFRKASPKIIPSYWKYALIISIPSIFNTLSDLILMQSDRLMLTSLVGAEETAEYSVVYNVSSIIVAIYQAINGAWTPWFYKKLAEDDSLAIKKYQSCYMYVFTIFTCGMMTISPEIIKLISPSNYWDGIRYVNVIVIASYMIFIYTFFSSYLMFRKNTGKIARNTVIAAGLNLMLNYLLIPKYEASGAVAATVVSYAILFFLHFFAIRKNVRHYFSISTMWMNIVMVSIYGIFFYYIRDFCIIRYLLFIGSVIIFYIIKGNKMIKEFTKGAEG